MRISSPVANPTPGFWSGLLSLTSVLGLAVALVGCATAHSDMMMSANNLRNNASTFLGNSGNQFPHASQFAGQVDSFLETVQSAGDREVILAYDRLWDLYTVVRIEVARSGSRQAEIEFTPVTQAFSHVAHDMQGYANADPVVYARGGFQHDPYYDP